MLDMEYVGNDYSVLLNDLEPEPKTSQEPNQRGNGPCTAPSTTEAAGRKPWWSLEFYQTFFDVTTDDVLNRLNASMTPLQAEDFQSNVLQEKPDLYGPFWICATLAIETGLSSYTAYYHHNYGHRGWRQTVRTVYQAGVLLFLYCWCLPTMLWIGLERNPISTYKFRLPELWCVFGYATSVLIPASAIWAIPVVWLRWLVGTLAFSASGIFICRYLKKALRALQPSSYYTLQALFFGLNYVVGCLFVVLFFPSEFHVDAVAQILKQTLSTNSTVRLLSSKNLASSEIAIQTHDVTGNFSQYRADTGYMRY